MRIVQNETLSELETSLDYFWAPLGLQVGSAMVKCGCVCRGPPPLGPMGEGSSQPPRLDADAGMSSADPREELRRAPARTSRCSSHHRWR